VLCVVVACGGEEPGWDSGPTDAGVVPGPVDAAPPSGHDGAAPPPADAGPRASVAFESPREGEVFVRDAVVDGEWAAPVEIRVRAQGVVSVDLIADGRWELGTARGPDWTVSYAFRGDGVRVLHAIGRDGSGVEVASDEVRITIEPPADPSCHAMLRALGLDWSPSEPLRGVSDPVRVQPTIRGVSFRYVSSPRPTAMVMDCELAPRLVRLAEIVRSYGIDEVIHLGIYNYRCIGGGDPDSGTCTPSMHAYARAIDLHAFGLEGSDEVYSTERDFVITRRGDPCPLMSFSEPDRILKAIACRLWEERVFQIVLTPNYNAAHRNHYHVDLTEGAMYLGVSAAGVDPLTEGLGD
jgi:hypothetical protein